MYKIISEDEIVQIKSIVALFYGEPGIGKTSLAFTAEKPLLEDYDRGVNRSVNRKAYLAIDSWEDAVRFHHSKDFDDFNPKTLVIDTAGTMLDNFIAEYAKRNDPKNARGGGELSLQGYGAMKTIFNQFVNEMRFKGIDIIFICHTETFKDGDDVKYRPKVTGGSYDILMSVSDMVGFMESKNNKRTIEFNPTDRNIGKNTAEFERMILPHYTDEKWDTFCHELLTKTKDKMQSMSESQKEAIEKLNEHREKIKKFESLSSLCEILPDIAGMSNLYKLQLMKQYNEKYYELYDIEIVTSVTDPDSANKMLVTIHAEEKIHQKKLQNFLKKQIEQLDLIFDQKDKSFKVNVKKVDDPVEKSKQTEKQEPEKKSEPESKQDQKKESTPANNGELALK